MANRSDIRSETSIGRPVSLGVGIVLLVALTAASLGALVGTFGATMLLSEPAASATSQAPPAADRAPANAMEAMAEPSATERAEVIELPPIHIVGTAPEGQAASDVEPDRQ